MVVILQMRLSDPAHQKIRNIQTAIHRVLDGDFPFQSGQRALQRLQRVFENLQSKLDRAEKNKDADSIKNLSAQINLKVYQTLPVIGFILRSTNVRNPFEFLYPLQMIADQILQGKPRLLLSSEWDYVPFAYPQTLEDLQSFVLIGMPASESANALLLPLAAHELGHAVWKNRGLAGSVSTTLQFNCESLYQNNLGHFKRVFSEYDESDIVSKEILPDSIALSTEYAAYQAEELFCDMVAYALFGASYLYAFGYIVSPGLGRPSPRYPTFATRISVLNEIAKIEGTTVPSAEDLFLEQLPRAGFPRDKFIIEMAENSVGKIKNALWSQVTDLLTTQNIRRPSGNGAVRHLVEFRMGVPACNPQSLGDIVNAGWSLYREDIVPQTPREAAASGFHNLNEIMLKTIEVLEINQRQGHGPLSKINS